MKLRQFDLTVAELCAYLKRRRIEAVTPRKGPALVLRPRRPRRSKLTHEPR